MTTIDTLRGKRGSDRLRLADEARDLASVIADPATHYSRPRDVLYDPELSAVEQRLALLSWARDALAAELAMREQMRELGVRSGLVDVLDALVELDREAAWRLATLAGLAPPDEPDPTPARSRAPIELPLAA